MSILRAWHLEADLLVSRKNQGDEALWQEKIPDIKDRIDMAVFPALQGGPHNHQIGALAVQLLEVDSPMFKAWDMAFK